MPVVSLPDTEWIEMVGPVAGVEAVPWDIVSEPPRPDEIEVVVPPYIGSREPLARLATLPSLRAVQLLTAGYDDVLPLRPARRGPRQRRRRARRVHRRAGGRADAGVPARVPGDGARAGPGAVGPGRRPSGAGRQARAGPRLRLDRPGGRAPPHRLRGVADRGRLPGPRGGRPGGPGARHRRAARPAARSTTSWW